VLSTIMEQPRQYVDACVCTFLDGSRCLISHRNSETATNEKRMPRENIFAKPARRARKVARPLRRFTLRHKPLPLHHASMHCTRLRQHGTHTATYKQIRLLFL